MRRPYRWHLRSRLLELGERTLVIGVVNVTPDSFYDGGRYFEPQAAIEHALRLLDDGADIIDIGGESTRPGAPVAGDESSAAKPVVSPDDELRRVMPVVEGVRRARPDAVISVDTYKSQVARSAVAAGVEIVNDVSAFQWDEEMGAAVAELECGVVMMHTRGKPLEWRGLPHQNDIASLVEHELANRVQFAFERGVTRDRIVLDPGFGFGKNFEENYSLLVNLDRLQQIGFPLLVGLSQKSFIGRTLGRLKGEDVPAGGRLYGSLATMVVAILRGAHVVRVHDVKPAVEAAAIADEVLRASIANLD